MTTGSPLKSILRFCAPLLIGNLFQQFYNLADSILVGRILGLNAFAAVGTTGALNFLILGFATGCCSGLAIPIARALAREILKASAAARRSSYGWALASRR
jgi:Na+-driven multidrug efflux pump